MRVFNLILTVFLGVFSGICFARGDYLLAILDLIVCIGNLYVATRYR